VPNHDNHIGQLIKKARKKVGLTQSQLAKRVGCTAPHLGRVEIGEAVASYGLFEKIGAEIDLVFFYQIPLYENEKRNDVFAELLHYVGKLDEKGIDVIASVAKGLLGKTIK
jgi:transcriptional regulator with XRE-family HTH domain